MEQLFIQFTGALIAGLIGVLTSLYIHRVEKIKLALRSSAVFREEIGAAAYKISLIVHGQGDFKNFARLKFLKTRLDFYKNTVGFLGDLDYADASDVAFFYHVLEEIMHIVDIEDSFLSDLNNEGVIEKLKLALHVGNRVSNSLERFEVKSSLPFWDDIQYKLGFLKIP